MIRAADHERHGAGTETSRDLVLGMISMGLSGYLAARSEIVATHGLV